MNKQNSILPKSLQSEVVQTNSRDLLKQKLKDRITLEKNNRNKISEQTKKKLEKDAKIEKKEVDNDPRVTFKMKQLFLIALRSYPGMDLANPCEILNNKDEYTLNYYKFSIDLLKKNNNNPDILNSPYCDYMKEVLEIK